MPVVLFTQYRSTARLVAEIAYATNRRVGLIMGGVENAGEIARQFQRGELSVLVGTLDKISEGLTLTRADCCIFVERSYRPTRNDQAMRRLHRISQTRPVTVIQLETKNSLDQRLGRLLKEKTDQQIQALSAAEFAALL